MPWARKDDFVHLLQRTTIRATVSRLERLAELATRDESAAAPFVAPKMIQELQSLPPEYKCVVSVVCRLYTRLYTHAHPKLRRIRLVYVLSAIVRKSVADYGTRSKYGR